MSYSETLSRLIVRAPWLAAVEESLGEQPGGAEEHDGARARTNAGGLRLGARMRCGCAAGLHDRGSSAPTGGASTLAFVTGRGPMNSGAKWRPLGKRLRRYAEVSALEDLRA